MIIILAICLLFEFIKALELEVELDRIKGAKSNIKNINKKNLNFNKERNKLLNFENIKKKNLFKKNKNKIKETDKNEDLNSNNFKNKYENKNTNEEKYNLTDNLIENLTKNELIEKIDNDKLSYNLDPSIHSILEDKLDNLIYSIILNSYGIQKNESIKNGTLNNMIFDSFLNVKKSNQSVLLNQYDKNTNKINLPINSEQNVKVSDTSNDNKSQNHKGSRIIKVKNSGEKNLEYPKIINQGWIKYLKYEENPNITFKPKSFFKNSYIFKEKVNAFKKIKNNNINNHTLIDDEVIYYRIFFKKELLLFFKNLIYLCVNLK